MINLARRLLLAETTFGVTVRSSLPGSRVETAAQETGWVRRQGESAAMRKRCKPRKDPLMVAFTRARQASARDRRLLRDGRSNLRVMFKPPFAWREFILQAWFVARGSIVPTLIVDGSLHRLLTFTFNILLTEFGAADFSGTGAALGTVRPIGADRDGSGGRRCRRYRHVCRPGRADDSRGARCAACYGRQSPSGTCVPRVLAATVVSLALAATGDSRGTWLVRTSSASTSSTSRPVPSRPAWTLIIGSLDVTIALIKAALFGLSAGLIACLQGASPCRWRPGGCG